MLRWRCAKDLLARYGQHTDALALYESVIQDEPDDPRAYYGIAEALRLSRQFDDAIGARRQATIVDGGEWPYDAELRGETATRTSSGMRLVGSSSSCGGESRPAGMSRRSTSPAPTRGRVRKNPRSSS